MYSLIIIDDEVEILESIRDYYPWESIGFSVINTFSAPFDAIEFCKTNCPDVVLTDIKLPFYDGFKLIEAISEISDPKPIFCVMSAYSDFEYAQKAIRLGVKDYLVKPASFEDIKKVFLSIKEVLDSHEVRLGHDIECDNSLIKKMLAIIAKKLGTCTLESIADELGMNHSYISRLFKKEMGENFHNYLMKCKIEQAKAMLVGRKEYSNQEIASALGYADTPNFCRLFKKETGLSPQRYRKEHYYENR